MLLGKMIFWRCRGKRLGIAAALAGIRERGRTECVLPHTTIERRQVGLRFIVWWKISESYCASTNVANGIFKSSLQSAIKLPVLPLFMESIICDTYIYLQGSCILKRLRWKQYELGRPVTSLLRLSPEQPPPSHPRRTAPTIPKPQAHRRCSRAAPLAITLISPKRLTNMIRLQRPQFLSPPRWCPALRTSQCRLTTLHLRRARGGKDIIDRFH